MTDDNKELTNYFRKVSYFDSDFPFSIQREIDLPQDYNENTRFQREFWKIIYIVDGRGEKIINDERYPIQPGSIFMIHPLDVTTFNIQSSGLDLYNILFMPDLIKDALQELQDDYRFFTIMNWRINSNERPSERLYVAESDMEIKRIVKTMEREFKKMPQNYRQRLKLLLVELLIILARKANKVARENHGDSIVSYINHMIDSYYKENLTLEALGHNIGIDKSQLCRIYKQSTNQTIMDNLRIKRLEIAANDIKNTDRNISEICFSVGFNDLSYFYRAFGNHFKLTPGECRKNK